ncbi:hypothetical protein JL721_286 [Aureococcus anophagefferens]|nr:hypothetical protein JL721_286 [Aureococcus anophagefferens]
MSGGSPRLQKIPAPRKGSRKKEPGEQQQPEAQLTPRISPLMGKETQPGDLLAYLRMASHALGASMALESGRLYIDELQAALDGVAHEAQAIYSSRQTNNINLHAEDGHHFHQEKAVTKYSHAMAQLGYVSDQWFSHRLTQFLAMIFLALLITAAGGLGLWLVGDAKDVQQGTWNAWTYMADPGSHAGVRGTGPQVVAITVTILGVLLMAAILGFIVEAIQAKMEELKSGLSRVVESGHTLILGWTHETVMVIEEICIANESEGGGIIVVLADMHKQEMEMDMAMQLGGHVQARKRLRGTKVVLRSGSPMLVPDLAKVSATEARATLILAEPGLADLADAHTLRCTLALLSLPNLSGHVVAEMRDLDNEPLVRLVGGELIETLTSHDILGRLMLMSAREPGLASVYATVLGFVGDEFYAAHWPELVGVAWREVAFRFRTAIPIGIRTLDDQLILNPPGDRVLEEGDEIVVLAEDNDTYAPGERVVVETGPPPVQDVPPKQKEMILCCGWRRDIRDILLQLDKQVARGSELHMMSDTIPLEDRNRCLKDSGLDVDKDMHNLKIVHFMGNTAMRRCLESLPIAEYDSCMILADQSFEAQMMQSDSHVIASLLQLREIQKEWAHEASDPHGDALAAASDARATRRSIMNDLKLRQQTGGGGMSKSKRALTQRLQLAMPTICEVLDPRTQNTIERNMTVAHTSDFCQSNKLIAQILAMCTEDRSIQVLLNELLGPGGVSFSMQPASRYAHQSEHLNFYELAARVQSYGETLCGYQTRWEKKAHTIINPQDKGEKKLGWEAYDLIVLQGTASAMSAPDPALARCRGPRGAARARRPRR